MDQDQSRPLISVNIVTYNRGQFIKEAVESVLAQSISDWELIIIDDASTDNTKEIITPYLADTRVKYFKNEKNCHISYSRNRGLEESRGKFVAILDSDDLWNDPNKLAKQVAFLENNPDHNLVGTGVIIIDTTGQESKRYLNPLKDNDIREVILSRNTFAHSSVMYRREKILSLGSYDLELNGIEDYDLWLKIGQQAKMANLADWGIKYRRHQGNISLTDRLRLMAINIRLVKNNSQFYPHFVSAITRRYLRFCLYRLLVWAKR